MDAHANIMRPSAHPAETPCPLFMTAVPAGFPSPADDYIERKLDLNSYLVKHPAATFFVRADGDSMIDAGIHHGDIMVVDRAVEPRDDSVVIAVIDGELTVKRLRKSGGRVMLVPGNGSYDSLHISEDMDFTVWGVVTAVIHEM